MNDTNDSVRLQKVLSQAGVASRRAAEKLIADGRVTVNGKTILTMGVKVDPHKDDVRVDGRRIKAAARLRYILLYKPTGFVTTRSDPQRRRTVMDLIAGVREYVLENVRMWLKDFHLDGLRLDAVHAIYDLGATHILREIREVADEVSDETGRTLHIIAESDLNDPRIVESRDRGGHVLDAQWSDDFHHAVHAFHDVVTVTKWSARVGARAH